VKERPILFSGPMVRAILAGTKTQTRRIVKPQPQLAGGSFYADGCPYGASGGRLWVRETWRSWERTCREDDDRGEEHTCSAHCRQTYVAYEATPRVGYRPVPDRARITYLDESTPLERDPHLLGPWKPSIHMPRAFSRIVLEVTSIRAERLQNITEIGAENEGLTEIAWGVYTNGHEDTRDPIKAFRWLWDEINGDRASWASNPWVWVVGFRRLAP